MTARRSGRFAKVRLATGPRLHYAEFGDPDGQAILFLHGWPDSWFTFSRVLELLPEGFRALAIDQRRAGGADQRQPRQLRGATGAGARPKIRREVEHRDSFRRPSVVLPRRPDTDR